MPKKGLKKISNTHRTSSKLALKRKQTVWCPKCRRDIQQQLNSHTTEEIFLIYHQARDRKCLATQTVECRQRLNAAIARLEKNENVEDDEDENWEDYDEYDPFDLEVPEISAAEFTATNVLEDPAQPEAVRDFVLGEVQIEETRAELRDDFDAYKLHASEEILQLQQERIRVFEEGEFKKQFKSMRRSNKDAAKK